MSVVVYHFWSPTCKPCKAIKPAIEELKNDFSSFRWITINTHEDPQELSKKFKIQFVPSIAVVRLDESGSTVSMEKHTGVDMMGYYRILKNATQQLSK
jgi:thiol-disulfide isomerase/thioredoxin